MSDSNLARRTDVEISFAGVNITSSIKPYLRNVSFTDNEEDETDDLQIKLHDRDGLWLEEWLTEAEEAAAGAKLIVNAAFLSKNRYGDGGDLLLDCGDFELDDIKASGPPATVTLKATSLPYTSRIRQTKKSKAWEGYYLSGIATEMAGNAGMSVMYESANDPYFERVEQLRESDIAFLSTLCHRAGISLKATNGILVLFDQRKFESADAIMTIAKGDGSYTKYDLSSGTAETQYASCRVSYVDPNTAKCIEATAKVEDYNDSADNNQQLEITAKVVDVAEAQALAEKMLRLNNKYAKTASFTVSGNPALMAGLTVMLSGWGGWSGKYIIKQAKHSIGNNGYTTQISLRRVLEGY